MRRDIRTGLSAGRGPRTWYAWTSCITRTASASCAGELNDWVGTTADERVAPAFMPGGGTKVCPGSAPPSILAKTDCHDLCTDSGDWRQAMYMSSMYEPELPLRNDSNGCGGGGLLESARLASSSGARRDTPRPSERSIAKPLC